MNVTNKLTFFVSISHASRASLGSANANKHFRAAPSRPTPRVSGAPRVRGSPRKRCHSRNSCRCSVQDRLVPSSALEIAMAQAAGIGRVPDAGIRDAGRRLRWRREARATAPSPVSRFGGSRLAQSLIRRRRHCRCYFRLSGICKTSAEQPLHGSQAAEASQRGACGPNCRPLAGTGQGVSIRKSALGDPARADLGEPARVTVVPTRARRTADTRDEVETASTRSRGSRWWPGWHRLTTGFAATLDAPSPQTLRLRASDEGGLDVVGGADEARAGTFEIGNPLRLFVELSRRRVVLALQSISRTWRSAAARAVRHAAIARRSGGVQGSRSQCQRYGPDLLPFSGVCRVLDHLHGTNKAFFVSSVMAPSLGPFSEVMDRVVTADGSIGACRNRTQS